MSGHDLVTVCAKRLNFGDFGLKFQVSLSQAYVKPTCNYNFLWFQLRRSESHFVSVL